ncbi:UNVERIFIED_CONTAM: hypothetical protein GTU68_043106 [Idotea baltica]|nr:hypothetical protein [Idotea baltica]
MKAGILIALFLIAFITVPLISLFGASDVLSNQQSSISELWQSTYFRRVVFFSLWQAFLSTFLSVFIGLFVARAFVRFPNFPFRKLILGLFGLPLVVPAVVAVLGIVSVYGNQGWLPIGKNLYGLTGILLAHCFFNIPLAVRLFIPTWNTIPEQHWRMAAQLRFSSWQQWKHNEWPALRENTPSVSLLIFMLCLTSFAVVLTLGGGPRSTTLEVAIYQSLRFDFDPEQAVILAILQLVISLIVALLALRFSKLPDVEPNLNVTQNIRQVSQGKLDKYSQPVLVFFAIIFVLSPLLAMLVDAFNGPALEVLSDRNIWKATAFSLLIGLSAASLSLFLAWFLLNASAEASYQNKALLSQSMLLSGSIIFVMPPLVIGTGLFILLSKYINVFDWAIVIVILINGLMGLPFIIRTLGPAIRQNKMKYNKLCISLNLSAWQRFKMIDLPLLRKPLGLSAALVTTIAIGDLGVIALFGSPETATLPLLLYQRLSSYQIPQAAVTAVFLLALSLLVFWLLEKIIGGKHVND